MKKITALFLLLIFLACGCTAKPAQSTPRVAVSTKPLAEFAEKLTAGTDIAVDCLVSEPVSCLHDYSLSVEQMKKAGSADAVFVNGLGLELFMEDALAGAKKVYDCSAGVRALPGEDGEDPHIWLNPLNAAQMAQNMAAGLSELYPQHAETIARNTQSLQEELFALAEYRQDELQKLQNRGIITFHDGFRYFADALGLDVLAAMEEEAGSEVAAGDLVDIIQLVRENALPAVFTEVHGSDRAAQAVAAETGVKIFPLDTALGEADYFTAYRTNVDHILEALS